MDKIIKTEDGQLVAGTYGRVTIKQGDGPGYALLATVTDEFSADELEAAGKVMLEAAAVLRRQTH